jgi:hypothetical protein
MLTGVDDLIRQVRASFQLPYQRSQLDEIRARPGDEVDWSLIIWHFPSSSQLNGMNYTFTDKNVNREEGKGKEFIKKTEDLPITAILSKSLVS